MRRWYDPLAFVLGALAVSSCHGQVVLGGTEGDSGTEPGAMPVNTSRSGSAIPSGSTSSAGAPGSGMAAAVPSASISFDGGTGGSGMVGPSCAGGTSLSGSVSKCSNGAHTTLTGKVYDPAGKVPLYNVIVFIPNDPCVLPAITPGASTCNLCGAIGGYVSAAVTDSTGSFTLKDVPTGDNIPLVVQIGKWRRIITVPHVADCSTTTVADSGSGQARLPRNRSEGDMPQMALLTGGLDDLGCFMARVGIDPAEYSAPKAGGRLDIYQGLTNSAGVIGQFAGPGLSNGAAGDCTNASCPLWSSKASLENYDIVLLGCEGDTFDPDATPGGGTTSGSRTNVTKIGKQAMHDWLDEGGKVFATHFHYTWFKNGPADFQGVANWLGTSVGSAKCDCSIDTSFPKGQALYDWLAAVDALSGNTIALSGVAASVSSVNPPTSRWIYDGTDGGTKFMSFETPIGGRMTGGDSEAGTVSPYCGKAVFTDLHTGDSPSGDVPGSCQMADLTAQEKAIEFLFFDLSSCVQDDTKPVTSPGPSN